MTWLAKQLARLMPLGSKRIDPVVGALVVVGISLFAIFLLSRVMLSLFVWIAPHGGSVAGRPVPDRVTELSESYIDQIVGEGDSRFTAREYVAAEAAYSWALDSIGRLFDLVKDRDGREQEMLDHLRNKREVVLVKSRIAAFGRQVDELRGQLLEINRPEPPVPIGDTPDRAGVTPGA